MDDSAEPNSSSQQPGDAASQQVVDRRKGAAEAEHRGLDQLERGQLGPAAQSFLEAATEYEELGDAGAANAAAQYLGVALYEQRRADRAVTVWEELVSRGWDRPSTFSFLQRHYEQTGDQAAMGRVAGQLGQAMSAAAARSGHKPAAASGQPAPGANAGSVAAAGRPLILVADHDRIVRRVLESFLHDRMRYNTRFTQDGEEALSLIYTERPDVIFLDVYMARRSGLDVLYQIRAEGVQTPVIIISGRPDALMARDCRALGAHFAGKPLIIEQLQQLLEQLVTR